MSLVVINVNVPEPFTVRVVKQGESTDRFISRTGNDVEFNADLGNYTYDVIVSKAGYADGLSSFTLDCTVPCNCYLSFISSQYTSKEVTFRRVNCSFSNNCKIYYSLDQNAPLNTWTSVDIPCSGDFSVTVPTYARYYFRIIDDNGCVANNDVLFHTSCTGTPTIIMPPATGVNLGTIHRFIPTILTTVNRYVWQISNRISSGDAYIVGPTDLPYVDVYTGTKTDGFDLIISAENCGIFYPFVGAYYDLNYPCVQISNLTIQGPTTAAVNSTKSYTVNYTGSSPSAINWSIQSGNANIVLNNSTYIEVKFLDSNPVVLSLSVTGCNSVEFSTTLTINSTTPTPVPIPTPVPVPIPIPTPTPVPIPTPVPTPTCVLNIEVSGITCGVTNEVVFNNVFNGINMETQPMTYSINKFPDVDIVQTYNAYLDRQYPSFPIQLEEYLDMWTAANKNPLSKGIIAKPRDYVECIDFYTSACPQPDDSTFTSARPYLQRYQIGALSNVKPNSYFYETSNTDAYYYGQQLAGPFGAGDAINGKKQVYTIVWDIENGLETSSDPVPVSSMAAMFAGSSTKVNGLIELIYISRFTTFGYSSYDRYPKPDGGINTAIENDESPGHFFSLNPFWTLPFTLNGEQQHITDYKNVIEVEEMTNQAEAAYPQGFEFKAIGSNTVLRVANHFGTTMDETGYNGRNLEHCVAKVIHFVETSVYFADAQGCDYMAMAKTTTDANTSWKWFDHQEYHDHQGKVAVELPRDITFMIGMMVFMNGAKGWYLFAYPDPITNLDSHNGILAVANIINKPFAVGGQTITLAGLRDNMTFNKWNSEISYDGGNTWISNKGLDYRKNQTLIPLRTAFTNDGYAIIFACRPYNTEGLSCKYRVTANGITYTGDITSSDWSSCFPIEQPNEKDYFLKIIKL